MSFDLSRVRFDARRDFLGVVMQQGRVQLDSDWNEWAAQLVRRLQAGTLDTFGGSVVPRITPDGFHIEAAGGALTIGPGRIYVDGLLAENHGATPDAWDPLLAELTGTTPLDFASQPYYPNPPALPEAAGPHLVYVDVWQRDVSAIQAPDLIEQAVGVDTTGRRQTVWQVRLLEDVGNITCATPDDEIPGWEAIIAPSAARLSTDTSDSPPDPDPCKVAPDAGYRGLENQLYRVEVHTGGPLGSATFKWSRDNATVASRVTHINPARDRITVESIGRDDVLRFNDGDWVEVTDDWLELNNLPGELRRISVAAGVDESARSLQFDDALPASLFPTDGQQATDNTRNTRVRRWDQSGQVRRADTSPVQNLNDPGSNGEIDIPSAGTQLFLEHGILVDFALDAGDGAVDAQFKTGDYWVFAARSTDASVELLESAPPLGIHHHYTRLSVVSFPDFESDCRTLWPPVADGDNCACTVCVTAEGHNNGSATIQQAIDSIKDTGGTVCLGIGTYNIGEAINIIGARSLRIKGQGWASMLIGSEPGGILGIVNSTGVALEDLTIIGSAGRSGVTGMISVHNVVDFRADHINVLGLSVGDSTSVAIGLSGYVLGANIGDCGLVAERGIATVTRKDRNYLVSAELRVTRNLFFCSQRATSFEGSSLHYATTRIADNLMMTGNQAAVVVSGAVLEGSAMSITDNVIYTAGDGIQAGVGGLAIERNEIYGLGARSGDGILLQEGLDLQAIDNARVTDNRLRQMRGNAISITYPVENAIIADNHINRIGLAALVMSEGASATYLDFSGNQCRDLGLAIDNSNVAFAALQLIRVERGDVRDNVVAMVAMQAVASLAIDGLRAAAVGQLRIAGNRMFGIGPDRISAPVSALHLLPPFDRVAIDDNSIERIADQDQKPILITWRAINISPDQAGATRYVATAVYFAASEVTYLLTTTNAIAFPQIASAVSIRGNLLRGHFSAAALNQCAFVDDCLFAENQVQIIGQVGKEPILGAISARTVNASNNRLVGQGDMDTLHLQSQIDRAIVMGNTSSGNIRVLGGTAVPADVGLTNIIGV